MTLKYPKSRLGRSSALLAACVALIGAWEGVKTTAYRDIVGIPTVCFGETRGVKMGDKYTMAECKEMLGDAVIEFEMGMRKCLKAPDSLPPKVYTAFLSTSYNIGVGAFCGSSMARKANSGDLKGACDSILLWNKAGGRVVKGLVNRRKEENQICLSGLKAA
jgi:lysozyme